MSTIRRRNFLKAAAAGTLIAAQPNLLRAQSNDTIKLGLSLPLSGPNAPVGQPQSIGVQIARDQINAKGGILGKELEFVTLDDQGDPARAIANLHELAGKGINLVIGPSLTSEAMAVIGALTAEKVVVMGPSEPDERLTHELYSRNYFSLVENNFTRYNAIAKTMAEKYPDVTRWTGIIFEAAVGHANWSAFSKALPRYYSAMGNHDVTLIDPIFCKIGTTDFKNQISQLLQSPAQGLLTVLSGSDGITFYQQMEPFALDKKFKVFVDVAIDINLGKALRRSVPTNAWVSSYWYHDAAKNPQSQQLADEFIKRTGELPHGFAGPAHMAVNLYASAIRKSGSTDTEKIISALEGIHLDSVKGPAFIRAEDHQVVADTYLFTLKPKDGPPGFETNETITVHMADIMNPPAPGTVWKY